MPDEAIYAIRGLTFWQHGSLPLFGASGSGYSALYPAFAGGPLSIGSAATGYAVLKAVQALVMSLAAWPVYAYTRKLVAEEYALLAAALTLACPLVLFSGLVMTEVLYYPLAALALLASARARLGPVVISGLVDEAVGVAKLDARRTASAARRAHRVLHPEVDVEPVPLEAGLALRLRFESDHKAVDVIEVVTHGLPPFDGLPTTWPRRHRPGITATCAM